MKERHTMNTTGRRWSTHVLMHGLLYAALAAPAVVTSAQEASSTTTPASDSEIRVDMGGDAFKTDMKNGVYTWTGNARFIRGNESVFSDELMIYMTPERQVEKAIAKGNVRILTEAITASGDEGTFYLDEQKVEITGHAKAAQGNNSITAHRIMALLEGSALEAYGSRETERVIMTIYSEPVTESPDGEAGGADVPEPPADPQPPSLIAIESDTLQYDESQEYAVFTGMVQAQQQGLDIRADKMRVYLTAADDAAAADEGGTSIDRIEVSGNVKVRQDGIIVTGADGEFDQVERAAVITGTAAQQARAENTDDRSILHADTITILLDSDDIQAEGDVSFETIMTEPAAEEEAAAP